MTVALQPVMKIAISHWQGRISPVFDVAQQVLLIDVDDNQIVRRQNVSLGHGDPFCRARKLAGWRVELLVCGAISHPLENALVNNGIRVVGFTCGDVDIVLSALQTGQLGEARFRMPGFTGPVINGLGRRCGSARSGGRRKRTQRSRRSPSRGARSMFFHGNPEK